MEIKTVGVVGAGLMGSGIAQVCAAAGLEVILHDVYASAIERALTGIEGSLGKLVAKEKMTAADAAATRGRISGAAGIDALAACDFVIEAATENVDIKQEILGKLERVAKESAVIATNTSSVSITKLAASLSTPERLVGMHFFNPVPVMALVEVIRGIQTSDATFEATMALATRIGKTTVRAKNSPGFIVNRILVPMINEAIFAFQEGLSSAEDIDAAMKLGANHPIGPLALADLIGLDTVLAIMEVFYRDFGDSKYRPAPLLKEMVDAGYLGRKSKQGFYAY